MSNPLLNDENTFPSDEIIKTTLNDSYGSYAELIKILETKFPNIDGEWKFYKDSKCWLCKFTVKKKTVFWLSIWDSFFKCTFYFTDKTIDGIVDEINDDAEIFSSVGKLIPVIFRIGSEKKFDKLEKAVEYKLSTL